MPQVFSIKKIFFSAVIVISKYSEYASYFSFCVVRFNVDESMQWTSSNYDAEKKTIIRTSKAHAYTRQRKEKLRILVGIVCFFVLPVAFLH